MVCDFVFNSMAISFLRYPSKEEFTRVAMEVITKYPFMKSHSGSPTASIIVTI